MYGGYTRDSGVNHASITSVLCVVVGHMRFVSVFDLVSVRGCHMNLLFPLLVKANSNRLAIY